MCGKKGKIASSLRVRWHIKSIVFFTDYHIKKEQFCCIIAQYHSHVQRMESFCRQSLIKKIWRYQKKIFVIKVPSDDKNDTWIIWHFFLLLFFTYLLNELYKFLVAAANEKVWTIFFSHKTFPYFCKEKNWKTCGGYFTHSLAKSFRLIT